MGTSASRKSRNASPPFLPGTTGSTAAALVSAFVGSVASYAASSEARSAGRLGAWGLGGSEYALTAPTCASLA